MSGRTRRVRGWCSFGVYTHIPAKQQIRASTLSGECDWIEEFDRGVFGMRAQHQVRAITYSARWTHMAVAR